MENFTKQHCVPCEGGTTPLTKADAEETMKHVPGWVLSDDGKLIVRDFVLKDFKDAMVFANKVAALVEGEGHHPDISIKWNKVSLTLTTHAIDGLSTNDFILASKVNQL
jgi:4a-hydroxytetrahydrobiopterin dehydratase